MANSETMPTRSLARGGRLCSCDPDPRAIASTMPDAWLNFNAATCLLTGSDAICETCDIQATVRAAKDKDRHR
jgi:hypothetical protein